MKIWLYYFLYFFRTVLAVLALILMVYYVITYLENLLYYFKFYPVTPKVKFLYYFWQLPDLIVQILPFSVLIAGVIVHWTIARAGEVTALRSAGSSLLKISFPFICCALVFGALHFAVAEFIRPHSFRKFSYIKNQVIEQKIDQNIFEKTSWIKSGNSILHFSQYIEPTHTLDNPEYFVFNSNYTAIESIIRSHDAQFDNVKKIWVLNKATMLDLSNPNKHMVKQIESYETDITFSPPKVLKEAVSSTDVSFFKLRKIIESARDANIKVSDRLFDLYLKTSLPFSSVIFLLFTIPFAAQSERKESSYFNILLCLALTTTYWFGNLAFKKLAINELLPPFIAAWSLSIIFTIAALIVIAKQDKPS